MKNKINIIVAVDKNNAIGYNNQLLFKSNSDMQHFKSLTMGSCVIMGRKTHESIGKKLPGRTNIIVSRDKNYKPENGCILYNDLHTAIKSCKNGVFVIGGSEIYKQALEYADNIYLTRFEKTAELADSYFDFNLGNVKKRKFLGTFNDEEVSGTFYRYEL